MRTHYNTPAENLHIVNAGLKEEIETSLRLQRESDVEPKMRIDAASLLEEMTVQDMVDWACKSVRPVTTMENNQDPSLVFNRDPKTIKLPEGFCKSTSVSFSAVGDLIYSDNLKHSKNKLYEHVADKIFGKDISYANFESPITFGTLVPEIISDASPPIECSGINEFITLTSHNGKFYTVLNTANNHALDMGIGGIINTHNIAREHSVEIVGTNTCRETYGRPTYITKNDIKFGFISYTFGLNGHEVAETDRFRVNTADLLSKHRKPDTTLIKQQIDCCKENHCDFVITSLHWGYEFELFPRDRQINALRELAEYGSDAIICHHPHVIQPIDHYRTLRDKNRVVPIAYSLGSLNWGFYAPHLALSLIQELQICKGMVGSQQQTYVETARHTPIYRDIINNVDEITTVIYPINDSLEGHCSPEVALMKKYCSLVLGK